MNKKIIASLLMTIGVSAFNLAHADEGRGFYVGGFAGAGRTDNQNVEQTGVAYKSGPLAHSINEDPWNLYVDVKGKANRETFGLGGIHVGYEWAANSWNVRPAFELEAFYLNADQNSNLANPNVENGVWTTTADGHIAGDVSSVPAAGDPDLETQKSIPAGAHTFSNHMNMNMALFMANGIFTYETQSMFKPYVGAGLGFAYMNMSGAQSLQTNGGVEQVGDSSGAVNHFNSRTHDSDITFAAQLKLGLRAELDKHWSAFAEYRYIHIASSDFTFGSTNYVGYHVPTSDWKVQNDSMGFQAGLVGIEYAF